MSQRLSLRRRLILLVTIGAAVLVAGATVAFNVLLRSSLDADANRLLASQAQTALETIRFDAGRARVIEDADTGAPDARAWVFAGGRRLERTPSDPAVGRLANSLAGTDGRIAEDPATDTRLYSTAIVHDGAVAGTVVSGISLEPYERTARGALAGSVILAAFLLLVIAIGARFVVGRALKPVAEMTAEAALWSETDLDHRFNVGQAHDELTALAATFDGMLDRLAESLRHEQRFTAEVSHELRTPLAAIAAEAELALRRERADDDYRAALAGIAARARELQRIIETLLATARAEAAAHGQRCDPAEVVRRVLEAHRGSTINRHGHELELTVAAGARSLAAEQAVVERILAPLVENASAHASSRVWVTIEPHGEDLRIVVGDDGPGVVPAERERIFEPGYRGAVARDGGAGLGLALSRRLARTIGGEVAHSSGDAPGGSFFARLPAA